MTLLHCLRAYQQILTTENQGGSVFKMAVVVVDLGYSNSDLRPLVPYLTSLGVAHHLEKKQISDYRAHSVNLCSNLKQEAIVNVAKRYGYNVLALAQNLDDMAVRHLMLCEPSGCRIDDDGFSPGVAASLFVPMGNSF
ncbi:hypothetical protein SprV_0100164500 [Sparganum proliferum]